MTPTPGHDPDDVLHEDIGDSTLWTRVNIAEACPGVPTPLTWSWFGYGSDVGVSRGWVRMGVLPAWRGERQARPGDRMVAIHAGRPVLNLGILREIGGSIPGSSAEKVERQFFASETAIEPGPTLWRRYPRVALKLIPAIVSARRELLAQVPDTLAWWSASVAELSDPACDPARARTLLAEAFDRYLPLTTLQTVNSLSVSGLYDLLVKLCARHGLTDQAGALSTSDELTPEALTVEDLWRLSRGRIDLAEFLGRHGYHAPVQGELAVPSWRIDASPVLKLAESYRRRPEHDDPVTAHRRLRAARDVTERRLLSSVPWPARVPVRALLRAVRALVPLREVARLQFMQCADVARAAAAVLGAHLVGEGRLEAPEDVYQLTGDELIGDVAVAPGVIALRRERREVYLGVDLPMRFVGYPETTPVARSSRPTGGGPAVAGEQDRRVFTGLSGSRGVYEGRARVITEPDDADELLDGEILVCETTNPSWASYFLVAGAVVVDIGGPLSHGPIVAREMGIPCVINTRDARLAISTGDLLRVDGTAGVVEILEHSAPEPAPSSASSGT
ncbi:MAG TPA: PEP-utilizing enzyme [Pseudonocardia sp.]|nr:PEP-utilizing enzyme [Pseudonocardia sp.]